jgi:hypothetical protein
MTNKEAGSILPVIYDSSLPNKKKITDLLGIPVNDDNYNIILNSENNDPDAIISSIKQYIGSSVTFKQTSTEEVDNIIENTNKPLTSLPTTTTKSSSTTTKSPSTTTESPSTTIKSPPTTNTEETTDEKHKTFIERIEGEQINNGN